MIRQENEKRLRFARAELLLSMARTEFWKAMREWRRRWNGPKQLDEELANAYDAMLAAKKRKEDNS